MNAITPRRRRLATASRRLLSLASAALLVGTFFSATGTPQAAEAASAPRISSLKPSAGLVTGGTKVIIRGKNFSKNSNVTFDGVKAKSVKRISSTKLSVVTPSKPGLYDGTAKVRVISGGKGSPASSKATYKYTLPKSKSYSGYGPDVLKFSKPDGSARPAILKISHRGESNFSVVSLTNDYDYNDLLVNEIGNYNGTILLDAGYSSSKSTYLEIDADGEWTVEVMSGYAAPVLRPGGTASGTVDAVYAWTGKKSTASFRYAGDSNFIVQWMTRNDSDLIVNEIGSYSGKRLVQAAPAWLTIEAVGPWTVKPKK